MDKILFIYYANNNKIESIGVFFIELHIIIHHLFMQYFFLLKSMHNHQSVHYIKLYSLYKTGLLKYSQTSLSQM